MGSEAPSLMETMAGGTHAAHGEASSSEFPPASDSTSGAIPVDRAVSLVMQADLAIETAILALREASALQPRDVTILEKLSALATAAGDHRGAVDARVAIAEAIADPRERALAFVAAARLAGRDAATVGRAVALFEAAIADDPAVPGAFEATLGVLVSHGDWPGVDAAYVRQLERLGRAGASADAIATMLDSLARVRTDKLGDKLGAIQVLDKLVALRPTSIDARAKHAALLEENGQLSLAREALETLVAIDPQRAESLRALHRLHVRARATDRAYGSAMSLVYLGEADDATLALYHRFAPRGLVAPKRPFDAQIWELFADDDHPREVAEIIHAIAPAALAMRLESMRAAGQLSRPDAREKQDPDRSTVAAVRTVAWAAQLLGTRIPDVYARGTSETAIALVPQAEPGIQLGRPVLTGRALPELAFLLASELAFQRCTDRLASLYPTLGDLGSIVLAGVALAMPRATHDSLNADVIQLAQGLGARLDGNARATLADSVARLQARNAPIDLLAWLRSCERISCRVGLVACGDVNIAARLVATDGRAGSGSVADRVRDLLAFSASPKLASIRSQLGIAFEAPIGSIAPSADGSQELHAVDLEFDEEALSRTS